MNTKRSTTLDADQELIRSLGGPTKLAELLGFKKPGSVQRVQNWIVRGIPAAVKLAHPKIFLAGLQDSQQSEAGGVADLRAPAQEGAAA